MLFILVFKIRYQDVFRTFVHTFSKCFRDVFKKSIIHLVKTSWRRVQDIFKTFSRYFREVRLKVNRSCQHVSKTSLRCLQYVFEAPLRRVFKTYHWTNNGLVSTFSTSSQDALRNLLRLNLIDIWKLTELFSNTLCSDCFYKLIYSCLTQVSENIMLSQ